MYLKPSFKALQIDFHGTLKLMKQWLLEGKKSIYLSHQ